MSPYRETGGFVPKLDKPEKSREQERDPELYALRTLNVLLALAIRQLNVMLAMGLVGCAESHALPPADAGTCIDPHPDCFQFLTDDDRAIRWLPRTDCTERPMRERYAMRPIWPEPEGTPCGNGGTCGTWGVCEGGPT